MPNMLFDFSCVNGHTTEHFVESDMRHVVCPECGFKATRIISPISFSLDHTLPGQSMKWIKDHEKAGKDNNFYSQNSQ